MTHTLTKEELIHLVVKAGFSESDETGLSGKSALDESIYCGEYPVGENIKRLAELLGVTIIEGDAQ